MTFRKWLIAQKGRRNSLVGDLAHDVSFDEDVPENYRAMRRYIEKITDRHPNVLPAVDEAWAEYKKFKKR